VLAEGIPRDVLINVNFPDCAPEEVKGIVATTQGKRDQELLGIDERKDGRGNPYYWIAFRRRESPKISSNSDMSALSENRISVTPLRLDLTDEPFMTRLAQVFA
jgi:5'-nucleotidase